MIRGEGRSLIHSACCGRREGATDNGVEFASGAGTQCAMHVLNALAPVFLIIALGAVLRRIGMIPPAMAAWSSALTYWVALPTLLFVETAKARVDFSACTDLLSVLLGGMLICIGAGWGAGLMLRLPAVSVGSLAHVAYRGNLAFVGIPVAVYSLGGTSESGVALAILMIAALIPFYNAAAVILLLAAQHKSAASALKTVANQIWRNPLILACGAGLAAASLGVVLPVVVARTLGPVGAMALPLSLLTIGATLDLKKVRGCAGPVTAAALIKVALSPLAGYALGKMAGVTDEEMRIALILLSCPTAAASYVMADILGGDTQLTAGAIVLSTLLSFVALFAVLWI